MDADTDDAKPRSSDDHLNEVHQRAMRRFDAIWLVEAPQRAEALEARRFEAERGATYQGVNAPIDADADAEENGGTARMEIPTFLRPVRRVRGRYRSARKTVDFRAKGDDSDRATADNLDGLYRADENESVGGGQHAYLNAFTEGSSGGYGGWRLGARYEDEEDEENERQRVVIESVYDADQSMFFDINAKAQDKSDAKHAFLLFTMTREAFEEEYPDATPSTFTDTAYGWEFGWTQPDTITLAEYWEVEDRSVLRRTFRQVALDGIPLPDGAEPKQETYDDATLKEKQESGLSLASELRAKGWRQVKQRRIKRQAVRKYLLTGAECLEDEGYIAGPNIPLVPFYMERSYVRGVERVRGMIQPVMDAVRINNLVLSNLAEAANGPTNKIPVFAPEQMDQAIALDWAKYKVERPAFLLAKPIYGPDGESIIQAGPTAWIEPDQIQPATAALATMMGGVIDQLMGVNVEAESVPANTSAQAIELVNDRSDINEILWEDNFSIAMQRSGEVWKGMACELYVEEGRKMTAIDMEGKQSTVTLNEPVMDDQGQYLKNDLTRGKFDVIVDVGPATKTRRDAVVKSNTALAEAYQNAGNTANANAALGVAVINMEGEGTDQFREFVRKQGVQEGWAEPTDEERKELQAQQENAQPDPNTVIAQAAMVTAQADLKNAETKALEAQSRYITAQANLKVAEAKATVALASIDRDDAKQILAEVKAETDSDRADEAHSLQVARASTEFERHDRDMTQPEARDGE